LTTHKRLTPHVQGPLAYARSTVTAIVRGRLNVQAETI
jgi:hypothetical protein